MINNDAQEHFRWIGIIADRIINAKNQETELPLLCLSFLDENYNLTYYSSHPRPNFPITIEDLSNAQLYGIIVSTISSNKKSISNENNFDFDLILSDLSNEGYIPQKPCDSSGLKNGDIEQHINLCRSIEFLVVDKSLSIDILESDLRRLPRSFFVLKSNEQIDLLEDAISLWLSKFHCNANFAEESRCVHKENYKNNSYNLSEKNYRIQIDTSNFAKVVACLARIFPKQVNKSEIKKGETEEEIENNKKISKIILDELHAYVVEKFPTDERLFMLFISDLFYATRSGARKFVKLDHNIMLQKVHSQPQPHILSKENYLNQPQASPSLLMKTSSYSPKKIETKIAQSPVVIKKTPSMQYVTQKKPNIVKPAVEPKQPKKVKDKKVNKIEKNAQKSKIVNTNVSMSSENQNKCEKDDITKVPENDIENIDILNSESKNSNEELTKQVYLDNDNKSDENKNEKTKCRKYILEFPEIEILLKRLIEKYPQNENNYNNYYDIFMRLMQEATIKNNPNISEIFRVSKAVFDQLIDNSQLLDYDFEQKLRDILEKTNINNIIFKNGEKDDKSDHNEKKLNSSQNDSNFLPEMRNNSNDDEDNEYNENDNNRNTDVPDQNRLKNINNSKISVNQDKNNENKSKSSPYNETKNYQNECDCENKNAHYDGSNNCIFNDIASKDIENQEAVNNKSENRANNLGQDEDGSQKYYDENEDKIRSRKERNQEEDFGNESEGNKKSSNDFRSKNKHNKNSSNTDDVNDNKTRLNEQNSFIKSKNSSENDDDLDEKLNDNSITFYGENRDVNDFTNNNNNNINDHDENHQNSNIINNASIKKTEKKVTFDLHQIEEDLNKNKENSALIEGNENDGDSKINNNLNSGENDKKDVDEMTDEMILREAEKILTQKSNPKLKQLSSASRKISTGLKTSATVSNYYTIVNALRFNSIPGPKYKKLYDSLVELLQEYKDERILLLMASRTQKFKGIYILAHDSDSASKLWGKGPIDVRNEDVSIYYKYINGQKSFYVIKCKSFTQTTDGFSLKKKLEPETW